MRHCGPLRFARAIARASSIRDMRAPISGSGPRFLSGLGSSLREERLQVRLDLFHSVLQRRDAVVKGLPAVRFELLGDVRQNSPGVLNLVDRLPDLPRRPGAGDDGDENRRYGQNDLRDTSHQRRTISTTSRAGNAPERAWAFATSTSSWAYIFPVTKVPFSPRRVLITFDISVGHVPSPGSFVP